MEKSKEKILRLIGENSAITIEEIANAAGLIFWLTNWFNTLIFVVVNRRPNSDELILKI